MLNVVILEGRLTKDPEVISLQNGNKIAKLSIVHNRSYKDANQQWITQAHYFDVVITNYLASSDFLSSLTKGTRIILQGSLRQERWQDKEGKNRSRVVLYTDKISVSRSSGDAKDQAEVEEIHLPAEAKTVVPEDDDIPF